MRFTLSSVRAPIRGDSAFARLIPVLILLLVSLCGTAEAAKESEKEKEQLYFFEIPSLKVEDALNRVAQQVRLQLLFSVELVQPLQSKAVVGNYTVQQALKSLLEGSNLSGRVTERGVIVVVAAETVAAPEPELERAEMKKSNKGVWAALVGLLSAPITAAGVQAQPEDRVAPSAADSTRAIEEVVVVARRREENQQEVPISITTYTADMIEQASITSTNQLGEMAPNLHFDTGVTPTHSRIYIRGIGQATDGTRSDPRVGMYLNGVYLPRVTGGVFDLLDIGFVQVLRGPQGTLFGKNTTGGAILIETVEPDDTLGGKLKLGAGGDGIGTAAGVVNVPLIEDRLATRVSAGIRQYDGYQQDLYTGRHYWDEDNKNASADVLAHLTDHLDFRLGLEYSKSESNGPTHTCIWKPTPGSLGGLAALFNPSLYAQWKSECNRSPEVAPKKVTLTPDFDPSKVTIRGGSGTFSWNRGDLTIKSITGYREVESSLGLDGDGIPSTLFRVPSYGDLENKFFSQDLQVAWNTTQVDWLVGAFYSKEEGSKRGFIVCLAEGLVVPDLDGDGQPEFVGGCHNEAEYDDTIKSWALYGEANVHLTPRWELTVGTRYTEDDKIAKNPGVAEGDAAFNKVTPRVNVSYQPSEQVMVYGGWSRGFTSGGFNNFLAGTVLTHYDPETLDTFEVGIKSEWLNQTLRLNAAIFYTKFDDQQVQVEGIAPDGSLATRISNAASSTVQGGEIELVSRPSEHWTISVGMGYTDASYDQFEDTILVGMDPSGGPIYDTEDLSGLKFPHTPKNNYNASIIYETPVATFGRLFAQADWNYNSKVYNNPPNTPEAATESRQVFNARLTFAFQNDRTELALWSRNLTDESYVREGDGIDAFDIVIKQFAPPRMWGIELTHRFGGKG